MLDIILLNLGELSNIIRGKASHHVVGLRSNSRIISHHLKTSDRYLLGGNDTSNMQYSKYKYLRANRTGNRNGIGEQHIECCLPHLLRKQVLVRSHIHYLHCVAVPGCKVSALPFPLLLLNSQLLEDL